MSAERKPQPGSNGPPRDLDAIAADIHRSVRRGAFEIGEFLIEAWEVCERGRWLDWLDGEFDMTERTAQNYMAAARLKEKYETVSYLPLPSRTIYELAADVDDPALPAVIAALVEATDGRSKPISVGVAEDVIRLARLRHEYGDYPEAALAAMAGVDGEPWAAQAIAALKELRPITDEAAAAIFGKFHRAHVASIYAPYGELPADVPAESLWRLGENEVPEDRRERVLRLLLEVRRPLTDEVMQGLVHHGVHDTDDDDDADDDEAADEDAGDEDPHAKKQTEAEAESDARDPDDAADTDADGDQAKQPPRAEVAKLVKAWVQASPEVKRQFVRERWDEIARARKQLDAYGGAAEDHWIEGDTL
jgi:hypothetical protein